MESICVVGNVTREPELRYTPTGQAVVKFGIAVDQSYRDRNGEKVDQTCFWDVTAWRDLAEHIAESIQVGTRLIVSGRVKQDSWEEKDTGKKRSRHFIDADSCGPDLRWATCQVSKVARADGWNGNGN